MKKCILVIIIVITIILTSCNLAKPQVVTIGNVYGTLNENVEAQIDELVANSGVPSIAVGVVSENELVWAKGYGLQPDLSTVYSIGSIDKSFTATAIMQLIEQELIDLDDDVNQYLPFSVRHPNYPDTPVTIRMILAHQSGLPHDLPGTRYTDNDGPMLRWMFSNGGHQFMDLYRSYFPMNKASYLEEVFSEESKYGNNFWVMKPGTGFQYSNSGYYLILGTIIEEVTNQSYQDYITENILKPLEMDNTSYEFSYFPEDQIAIPYEDMEVQGYSDLPLSGANASGKLRSTVPDLAKFLLFHMNQGELNSTKILEASSVDMMHARTNPMSGFDFPGMDFYGIGLGWTLWGDGLQGHSGATPGYFAQMLMQETETGTYGVILMMTYGCSITECDFEWFDAYFAAIREILLEHAELLNYQEASLENN